MDQISKIKSWDSCVVYVDLDHSWSIVLVLYLMLCVEIPRHVWLSQNITVASSEENEGCFLSNPGFVKLELNKFFLVWQAEPPWFRTRENIAYVQWWCPKNLSTKKIKNRLEKQKTSHVPLRPRDRQRRRLTLRARTLDNRQGHICLVTNAMVLMTCLGCHTVDRHYTTGNVMDTFTTTPRVA